MVGLIWMPIDSLKEAERYTAAAQRRQLARNASSLLGEGLTKRERNVPTFADVLSPPGRKSLEINDVLGGLAPRRGIAPP
jgi:hypothetical protein